MIIDLNKVTNNLIDIRPRMEFNEYHLNNSINIPKMVLLTEPEKYMNKNENYFIICKKGKESLSVAKILNQLGYKVYSIDGGIEKNMKNIF